MFKIYDKDLKLTVFALGLFLYMCISNDLCFTLLFPNSLRYLGGLLIPLVCGYYLRIKKFSAPYLFTALFFLYYFSVAPSLWAFLDALAMIVSVFSILAMTTEKKLVVLDLLKSYFTIILGLSIIGWGLYLMGVNLPYENVEMNDFHNNVNNYYLFSVDADFLSLQIFPRFSGMFLEPGQLATPCVLFMFADGGSMKDKRNYVMLLAVILSFSLVAYIMLAVGYSIRGIIINRKHILIRVLVPVSILIGVGFVIFQEANDSNPFYAMILSRLESDDDKGFVGNNRTNDYVDDQFDKLMHSPTKWRGISAQYLRSKADWLSDSSGYKKFILLNGLIGLLLLAILIYVLFKENKSQYNLLFLFLVILAFLPRSMITKAMWFYPIVLAFYLNNKQTRLFLLRFHGQRENSKTNIKVATKLV